MVAVGIGPGFVGVVLAAVICGHDGQGEKWELDDDDDVTGRGSECVWEGL